MAVPKLEFEPLKAIWEAESEIEDPQCSCGAYDDADCDLRDIQKCIRLEREREYGVVDENDYAAGRGFPRG